VRVADDNPGVECQTGFGRLGMMLDRARPTISSTALCRQADPINPTFTVGWLDYTQARGFATNPARVRSPKDKPSSARGPAVVRLLRARPVIVERVAPRS